MRQRIYLGEGIHQAEWLTNTAAGQTLLGSYHGGGIDRPRCACTPKGVVMYVGLRGRQYYLARMPGSGFMHVPGCPAYEKSSHVSGMTHYQDGLVVEAVGGGLDVRSVDFSRRAPADVPSVRIDGMLDILIEQAALNRSGPEDSDRTWLSVRGALRTAAAGITLAGKPFSETFFVPEKFNRDAASALHLEASAFIDRGGEGMICAPLREVQETPYGYRLVLKHLPYLKLWLSSGHASEIEDRYGRNLFSEPPRFAICLVKAHAGKKAGNYNVENVSIRETDALYLPCESALEMAAAEALREKGSTFVRPLRFDAPRSHSLADFVVMNGDRFNPVVCDGDTGDDIRDAARRTLSALIARNEGKRVCR